jgi:hypothetical protein
VQLDGSFHEWLEERGPRGCLMRMVDDATAKALGCFSEEGTIWAAAKSRVLVREDGAGEVAIHSRGQRLGSRELKVAPKALDEGRDAASSPAPLFPISRRSISPAPNHPWRKGFSAKARALFSGTA